MPSNFLHVYKTCNPTTVIVRVHKDKEKGERGNNKETQNIFQKEKANRKSDNIEE